MSRITRKTAVVTLTIVAKSDTADNKPVPSPPHQGDQPTRVYQGNQSDAELATQFENWVNDWFVKQFPQPLGASQMEFSSVSVVIT